MNFRRGPVSPFSGGHKTLSAPWLEPDAGEDFAKFSPFAALRVGPDAAAATQDGKVAKTLNINEVGEETRQGMLQARQKEWDKYRSFNATVVVSGAEKARLLAEGNQGIPSKWVDTIKNIHEINSPDFQPIYKARFSQDDDCTSHVDVRDNTWNLKPAAIGKDREMNDPLTQEELASLRGVVGGLAWISRYGWPDLAYRVNELQRCCHFKSTIQSLKAANRIVELALQGSDFKILFQY